ncbi:hypothetical protein YWIDRAFT_00152 [Streptomyces sp. SceaMP-e96]|nr:hypothetical protein YWIDRAFT_00152 [Streptomyces sp. SceaMP-e96]
MHLGQAECRADLGLCHLLAEAHFEDLAVTVRKPVQEGLEGVQIFEPRSSLAPTLPQAQHARRTHQRQIFLTALRKRRGSWQVFLPTDRMRQARCQPA